MRKNAIVNSNEKVYSKGPLLYLLNESDGFGTDYDMLVSYYSENPVLQRYFSYIRDSKLSSVAKYFAHESLYEICSNLPNDQLVESVVSKVLDVPGYDPYKDKFPLYALNKNDRVIVSKIQNYLKDHYRKFKNFDDGAFRLLTIYCSDWVLMEHSLYLSESRLKYQFVVMEKYASYIIKSASPYMMDKAEKFLNSKESGWIRHDKTTLIKENRSGLDFYNDNFITKFLFSLSEKGE